MQYGHTPSDAERIAIGLEVNQVGDTFELVGFDVEKVTLVKRVGDPILKRTQKVGRVTVVRMKEDRSVEILLDVYVKHEGEIEYQTKWSGLRKEDFVGLTISPDELVERLAELFEDKLVVTVSRPMDFHACSLNFNDWFFTKRGIDLQSLPEFRRNYFTYDPYGLKALVGAFWPNIHFQVPGNRDQLNHNPVLNAWFILKLYKDIVLKNAFIPIE